MERLCLYVGELGTWDQKDCTLLEFYIPERDGRCWIMNTFLDTKGIKLYGVVWDSITTTSKGRAGSRAFTHISASIMYVVMSGTVFISIPLSPRCETSNWCDGRSFTVHHQIGSDQITNNRDRFLSTQMLFIVPGWFWNRKITNFFSLLQTVF